MKDKFAQLNLSLIPMCPLLCKCRRLVPHIQNQLMVVMYFLLVFAIDASTGGVRTLVALDREDVDFYPIIVSARDSGTPPMVTNVSVMVTIGDVNDNDPYFINGNVLSVEVLEVGCCFCVVVFVLLFFSPLDFVKDCDTLSELIIFWHNHNVG